MVSIGSHCCISQRSFLCTGSHDFRAEAFDLVTETITIGDRCWIAAQTFVSPGVTMGANSMASAGSVITSDIPARTIVSGNPARPADDAFALSAKDGASA